MTWGLLEKQFVAGRRAREARGELLRHETWSNTTKYKFEQHKALVFAALAKLTYCGGARGTGGAAEKTCGEKGFCKDAGVKVKKGSVRTISLNDGDSSNALVAYVARLTSVPGAEHPLQPGCMAAVRGTWPGTNNGQRSSQQDMVPVAYGECGSCRVHQGYQEIWKKLMPSITLSLNMIGCKKSSPLYLTGHSMGGAVATLGMYAMKTSGWNVQHSYVFHNPKVGDAEWVKSFNTILAGSAKAAAVTRITHREDKVPTFPQDAAQDGSFYSYTWPEIHYFSKKSKNTKYQVCWGKKNCGVLQYSKTCSQSECDDHLVNPLAPNDNIALFKDPKGVCTKGHGTVTPGELPMSARSADNQLSWMSDFVKAATLTRCAHGWEPTQDCKSSFNYYGRRLDGCTTDDAWPGTAWCSLDSDYTGRWNNCAPCDEDEAIADASAWW